MREFKGYSTHNEYRDIALTNINRLFDSMNKNESGSGFKAEIEITDRYKAVYLGELSTYTLIKEYERLLG